MDSAVGERCHKLLPLLLSGGRTALGPGRIAPLVWAGRRLCKGSAAAPGLALRGTGASSRLEACCPGMVTPRDTDWGRGSLRMFRPTSRGGGL